MGLIKFPVICLIAVLLFLAFTPKGIGANLDTRKLNEEGIQLYRLKQFGEAIEKFKEAIDQAEPNSFDQMTALSNLCLPLEELKKTQDAWKVKRRMYLIRNKLQGERIPEDYDGSTFEEAQRNKQENKLKQDIVRSSKDSYALYNAKLALIQFYAKQQEQENVLQSFYDLVSGLDEFDSLLPAAHREWAVYYSSQGREQEAKQQNDLADLTEKKITIHLQQVAERRRQEAILEEQERLRQQALQQEEERRKAKIKKANQKLLEETNDLAGITFYPCQVGNSLKLSDSMKFIDAGTVYMHTHWDKYDGEALPDLILGTYRIYGKPGHRTLSVQSTFKGTIRIDEFVLAPSENQLGTLIIMGGKEPFNFIVCGSLKE